MAKIPEFLQAELSSVSDAVKRSRDMSLRYAGSNPVRQTIALEAIRDLLDVGVAMLAELYGQIPEPPTPPATPKRRRRKSSPVEEPPAENPPAEDEGNPAPVVPLSSAVGEEAAA